MPILTLIPMPDHKEKSKKLETDRTESDRLYAPEDLVTPGGYEGNPREIVQNPAVAPQMLNEPSDLRDDLMADADSVEPT